MGKGAVEPPGEEHAANVVSGCLEGRLSAHRQQSKSIGVPVVLLRDQFYGRQSPSPGMHPRGWFG